MKTNISKVDESFTDFLATDKLESKYGTMLSAMAGLHGHARGLPKKDKRVILVDQSVIVE